MTTLRQAATTQFRATTVSDIETPDMLVTVFTFNELELARDFAGYLREHYPNTHYALSRGTVFNRGTVLAYMHKD